MTIERLEGDNEAFHMSHDPLNTYLNEISRYPLLSREEEHHIACLVHQGGDRDAGEMLTTSNLKLVVKMALEYHTDRVDLLDLIQEGNLGLLQAVRKYDPGRGTKFSVYASFWIKAYILKHLRDSWSVVKVGNTRSERKLFYRLSREIWKPEEGDIYMSPVFSGVKEWEVSALRQRLSNPDVSLEALVYDEGDGAAMDISNQESIEEIVSDKEESRILARMIKDFRGALNDRETLVFDRRIVAAEPASLREMGNVLRISHERVRQIERKVTDRLNQRLEEQRSAVGT